MLNLRAFPHASVRAGLTTYGRPRAAAAAVVAVALAAAGSLVWAAPASAAVPAFPNNIVIFPDRDFVSIEGWEDDVDKTITITVTRDGQVTGRGEGVVAPGGVAIEVNHPGGVCWGTGAGAPFVTPDIQAGDLVTVAIDGEPVADTASIDAAVGDTADGPALEIDPLDPTVLYVRGHLGPGVDTARLEQRIIAPDLRDTVIARRDVRALPGPRVTDARGQYDSALEFGPADADGVDFTATYWFPEGEDSPGQIATLAKNGGARIMAWQEEDLDANRQGLTISEFGEPGGPGFGGCPNGPAQSGPPAPLVQSLLETTSGTGSHNYAFTWTPAVAVPGTPAITGYRVRAVVVPDSGLPGAEQDEFGKRVNSAAATGTTLSLPTPVSGTHYEFEVSSVNEVGNETNPPATPTVTPPDITGPVVTTSPSPVLTTFFAPIDVTLVSESGADLYYLVTDPAVVVDAPDLDDEGTPSAAAEAFVPGTPIHLTATSRVSVIGVDTAGNIGVQGNFVYQFDTADAPVAPLDVTATGGEGQATVNWTQVPDGDLPVLGYTIDWTGPSGPGSTTAPATAVSKVVSGLAPGHYSFTVTARNAAGTGAASVAAETDVTESLTVSAGADRSVVRGGAAVALGATSPNVGVTYTWTRVTSEAGTTEFVGPSLLSATTGASPTVTVPVLDLPTSPNTPLVAADFAVRNAPLFYRVTASKDGATSVTDVVRVSITTDTTSIATGRFRAGSELRLTGSDTNAAATVRIYRKTPAAANYTYVGTVTLTAAVGGATFDFRLRPPGFALANGEQFYAFSTRGGASAAFTAN